jgi:hypothetical protein
LESKETEQDVDAQSSPLQEGLEGETAEESSSAIDPVLAAIAADIEANRTVIVIGAIEPMPVLTKLIGLLPVEARRRLSLSAGLAYSPGRRLQLVLLPEEDSQLHRLVAGQDIVVHRLR